MSSDYDTLIESSQGSGDTDDDSGRFRGAVSRLTSTPNISGRLRSGVASLFSSNQLEQDPDGYARSSTSVYSTTVDIDRPFIETEDYWTEYRNNPIVSTQINGVGVEVFEAGYWLEADSSETEAEISEFLDNIGVGAGQTHRPFEVLGENVVTQYLVRGTFLGEKMRDSQGRHTGINPINPTTMEIYTKAGTNVLVPRDHAPTNQDAMLKQTDDGDVAAYVQFDEQFTRWDDRKERRFARDEILHWARKPDIGDVRGNSVIEPVYDRSRALREKLKDNDVAVSMKAWPMVIFQAGSAEYPWTEEEMRNLIEDYDESNLGPGSYQVVPGDIEIHEFAGETADIESHIQTDVNYIVAGLPGAKHTLGSFISSGQATPSDSFSGVHQQRHRKLIRSLRQDIENLFEPYLREVAESWGYDPSGLTLHIGRPDGDVAPEDVQGNIIRYQSDVNNDGDNSEPGTNVDGQTVVPDVDTVKESDVGDDSADGSGQSEEMAQEITFGARYSDDGLTTAPVAELATPAYSSSETVGTETELADPRLVSTTDIEQELGRTLGQLLADMRDKTENIVLMRAGSHSRVDADTISSEFQGLVRGELRDGETTQEIRESFIDARQRVDETLAQHTHPDIQARGQTSHRGAVDTTLEAVLDDVRGFADSVGSAMRNQIQTEVSDGMVTGAGEIEDAFERLSNEYSDDMFTDRLSLIVGMHLQRLVNRCKLSVYQEAAAVDGVRLTAPCADHMHPVTEALTDCGDTDAAYALFRDGDSSSASIGEQFQDQLPGDPPSAFDPLPDIPPYRVDGSMEFVPYTEDDT